MSSFILIGDTVNELCEFNEKKKKIMPNGKNYTQQLATHAVICTVWHRRLNIPERDGHVSTNIYYGENRSLIQSLALMCSANKLKWSTPYMIIEFMLVE